VASLLHRIVRPNYLVDIALGLGGADGNQPGLIAWNWKSHQMTIVTTAAHPTIASLTPLAADSML